MRNILFLLLLISLNACSVPDKISVALNMESCSDLRAEVHSAINACNVIIGAKSVSEPQRGNAYYYRARAHLYLKSYKSAIADFDDAIKLQPGNAHFYAVRGSCYGEMGKLDQAIVDFRQAIKLNPEDADSYANLGSALEKSGDLRGSLAAVNAALKINPDNHGANSERCWVRGVLNEDLEGALADCSKTIKLYPQDANAFNSRGFINFRLNRYQAAIDDYDSAIKGSPNVASSYYMRALAKKKLHQNTDITADIEKAKSLESGVMERYASYGVNP